MKVGKLIRNVFLASCARRATLSITLGFFAAGGCSSPTDAPQDVSTLTLISGANQTVTVNRTGLTDVPELVVVRLDSMGTPLAERDISVSVWMSGAPGANGPYAFVTDADGVAAMQLVLSNIPGPVAVTAAYVKCVRWGFKACDESVRVATVSVPGIVAQRAP